MTKLFVYGQLKPKHKYALKTKTKAVTAKAKGSLYDLGHDVGLKPSKNMRASGVIDKVSRSVIKKLDKEEKPQFKRIKIKTSKGVAETYKYSPSIKGKKQIKKWGK